MGDTERPAEGMLSLRALWSYKEYLFNGLSKTEHWSLSTIDHPLQAPGSKWQKSFSFVPGSRFKVLRSLSIDFQAGIDKEVQGSGAF